MAIYKISIETFDPMISMAHTVEHHTVTELAVEDRVTRRT